jgi:hypothetical protein
VVLEVDGSLATAGLPGHVSPKALFIRGVNIPHTLPIVKPLRYRIVAIDKSCTTPHSTDIREI